MRRSLLAVVFVAGGLTGWLAATRESVAVGQPPAKAGDRAAVQPSAKAGGAEAGIKAITAEYAKAFNAKDARAASMLFTESGEYQGADGEVLKGREQIEKSLAEFFKANPKLSAEITVESVKALGRGLATAEGVVKVHLPDNPEVSESRYTALHVLQDGKWLAASVGEWVPDPAYDVTTKNLGWLIGEWTAKGEGGEVKIVYTWGEDKIFLIGKYTLTKDGQTVSKGTQVIGRNPTGGLRSWLFDSTGTTSDAFWTRDDKRWINEATGVLPDGTEVYSVNVLIPLGPDAFTWQTLERVIDGVEVSGLPPVKVTRIKK